MNATTDPLVTDYLLTVERGLAPLPRHRRDEILDDLRDHLDAELGYAATEADVLNVLERLGDPTEIAAFARAEEGVVRAPRLVTEWVALGLLTLGGAMIPFVGWLVGVTLVWRSPVWTRGDKLMATLLPPFGPFGSLLLVMAAVGPTSSNVQAVLLVIALVALMVAPFITYLQLSDALRDYAEDVSA